MTSLAHLVNAYC